MLTVTDHSRDKAGLTYIYPVLSRRSGGLSIGVNLNINNACNWRCIYCQVPNLIRGSAPPVNLDKLGKELRYFLGDVVHGDFYDREEIPDELRVIKDIAISGNGEPTTASDFDLVVDLIELVLKEYGLLNDIKCVLITNGSMVDRSHVQRGLTKLSKINGEVWFKIDSATQGGIARINQIKGSNTSTLRRLKLVTELCPTWIQSCFFSFNDKEPSENEISAYISLLEAIIKRDISIKGIYLYGVARPSMQEEADRIKKLPASWFNDLAHRMNNMPFDISINP